MYRFR